jgi:hypothetical protein
MIDAKTEFLDDLEAEFGESVPPPESAPVAPRGRSKVRRRLIATGFAVSVLGGLLTFNAVPAAAAGDCLKPNFVAQTHYKVCSPYASVKHRYVRTETNTSGGHVMTCHYFYSSYRSPCAEDDFDTNACRAA